jgi:hypothetical protein
MALIKDNKNSFEVYLTDLGRLKFIEGGFFEAIQSFSLSDSGANYRVFNVIKSDVLPYSEETTYNVGDVVQYLNEYYEKVLEFSEDFSGDKSPENLTYWNRVVLYDSTNLDQQRIPGIRHYGKYKTSIEGEGSFIDDVFLVEKYRGGILDNKPYRKLLLHTNNNSQRDYILFEPDFNSTDTLGILTYIRYE